MAPRSRTTTNAIPTDLVTTPRRRGRRRRSIVSSPSGAAGGVGTGQPTNHGVGFNTMHPLTAKIYGNVEQWGLDHNLTFVQVCQHLGIKFV